MKFAHILTSKSKENKPDSGGLAEEPIDRIGVKYYIGLSILA